MSKDDKWDTHGYVVCLTGVEPLNNHQSFCCCLVASVYAYLFPVQKKMWGLDEYGDCDIDVSVINSLYTIGMMKFGAPGNDCVGSAANGTSYTCVPVRMFELDTYFILP